MCLLKKENLCYFKQVGADVVVVFYDKISQVFRAEDYYLSHLSQCDGKQGVCPDERIGGRNDVTVGKRQSFYTILIMN